MNSTLPAGARPHALASLGFFALLSFVGAAPALGTRVAAAAPAASAPQVSGPQLSGDAVIESDLVVYGGTPAGITAAVAMRRLGGRAVIVEPGRHLGGMTAGGLSVTDIGNKASVGGLSREFYTRIREYYLNTYGGATPQVRDCREGFLFEPHVAEKVFGDMLSDAGVPVYFLQRLEEARKEGNRIQALVMQNGAVFRGKMYLDATYEGDLMERARVSYTVGREASNRYWESLNGVHYGDRRLDFTVPIDPYRIPGDPASGLLKGISADRPPRQGEADQRIQAYNFRMCLTDVPQNRLPFPRPKQYDADRYLLLLRYIRAGVWDALKLSKRLPNGKVDANNHGAFSTDDIGANQEYPEGEEAARERIIEEHMSYQEGLMWFLCHDERVPAEIRAEMGRWGLAKDEFTDNGGWPHQLYVREARRMLSDYLMTERNCRGSLVAEDSIGLASYTMDSHNCQRVVRDGRVVNEGNVQASVPAPYPISYRSIVPKESECANLLVPVCLSASHIAYGSIRMEPVFMILGQSAGTAAYLAIDGQTPVQRLNVNKLQARLEEEGQILSWPPERPQDIVKVIPASDTHPLTGMVLDDTDAKKIGEWEDSLVAGPRRVGTGFVHDGNKNKGLLELTFTPDIPADGAYSVVLIYPPGPSRATGVPVTLAVEGVGTTTVRVNEREAGHGGFASLGVFKLPKGKRTTVTVSNRDTDGVVCADGLQIVPVTQ